MSVEVISRHDVDEHRFRDGVGMIERHAMRDAAAAVLPDDREALEPELPHDVDLI